MEDLHSSAKGTFHPSIVRSCRYFAFYTSKFKKKRKEKKKKEREKVSWHIVYCRILSPLVDHTHIHRVTDSGK